MENYIVISTLNDFIFCPRSIYFHQLYNDKSEYLYKGAAQFKGTAAHSTIDEKKYSSKKTVIQGMEVYSERYNIYGKIDIFFKDKGVLRERKKRIVKIYDGYILQIYAQFYCLIEMGYDVNKLELYSMDTNKIYPVKKPEEDEYMKNKFEDIIKKMSLFDINADFTPNPNKCKNCIYSALCDKTNVDIS
jgi:CRISPR-associated protein Cas4